VGFEPTPPTRLEIKSILEKLPPYLSHFDPVPPPNKKNHPKKQIKKGGWDAAISSTASAVGESDEGNNYKRTRFS